MNRFFSFSGSHNTPSAAVAAAPVVALLLFLIGIIVFLGAESISDYSHIAMLGASCLALVLSAVCGSVTRRGMIVGLRRSAAQILPAIPMLIFIALVSTTWMISGVVPTLIDYGLQLLSPGFFLVITCAVCGLISVLTGSSWSTIATIGMAFMGIGTVMGFNPGWIAGAIISGAYFGDKVSPLSDTTVVASSACGVDLFKHIRYLTITAVPAMAVALIVFFIVGLRVSALEPADASDIIVRLGATFNITPWTLLIPAATVILIALRVPTVITLACSSLFGLIGIYVFQPEIAASIGATYSVKDAASMLWTGTSFSTGDVAFDRLISTSGILGMLSTIALVLCAMVFGTVMIGTGMLARLTRTITSRLKGRVGLVGSTVSSGLFLNSCTADQYLSLIIGGNMYRSAYRRFGLEPRLLSRTLEDSVSVTSVLIPWNSCGVTQSAVLGVATLTYLPYCIFNYLSPVMSLLMVVTGFKIKQAVTSHHRTPLTPAVAKISLRS